VGTAEDIVWIDGNDRGCQHGRWQRHTTDEHGEKPPKRARIVQRAIAVHGGYQHVACAWRFSTVGPDTARVICVARSDSPAAQAWCARRLSATWASMADPVRRTPKSDGSGRAGSPPPRTRSRMRSPVALR